MTAFPTLYARYAALGIALALAWILNPYYGPSPIIVQAVIASAVALLWFLVRPARPDPAAMLLACSWLAAAVFNAGVGLAQYLGLVSDTTAWVSASLSGEVYGNLRQRNQLATLLAIGLASAFFLLTRLQGRLRWALAAAVVLLSVAAALTTSRTGMLHWILLCGVALLAPLWGAPRWWRGWAVLAAGTYALTMAFAPAMIERVAGGASCVSRKVLWQNALHLSAQHPWTGWGPGMLDYAHYATLYPGERFCLIVDNAHNLILHAAVELGWPFALLLLVGLVALVVLSRPWRERQPHRLLGWAVLALVLLHSMVEYPLWYGPFQLAVLLSAVLLWPRRAPAAPGPMPPAWRAWWALGLVALGYVAWDYHRISQIYLPLQERSALYPASGSVTAQGSVLFKGQVDFATFTTTPLTQANAARMADLGERVLHYSPEPQVIEKLIDALLLLGEKERAAWHQARFRAAFPDEHAQWASRPQPAGAP
ncbi:MAG: hypothetical protein RL513_1488 [Pseudomonadota bacterium]|jgi:O-antigen ligase